MTTPATALGDLLRALAAAVDAAGGKPPQMSLRFDGWALTLTSGEQQAAAGDGATSSATAPVSGLAAEPWHDDDFATAGWPTLGTFAFTPMQATVFRVLWEARAAGRPLVPQAELIAACGTEQTRISYLFRGHPAWQVLILSGPRGAYRLPPVPASVATPESSS
jgi:hypothetical protein